MNAPSSLCPGYKQVETFGPEEEYEDDEEVSYVVLDLGNVEPTLVPTSSTYRLIVHTPTPFLQLQGTIFKGRHDLLLGTELLFTDDKETHDRNRRSVVHVANTEQRIAFKEVTLIPKAPKEQAASKDGEGSNVINIEGTTKDGYSNIDRITGLSVPATRVSRTKKTASTSTTKSRAKAKGKEKAGTSKAEKGKGKEKVVPTEDIPMDEDPPEANDMDDIYMDE
ncbi:hypothetical protein BYT27DRAFT_7095676 [Phlegmacium glaucopus]|nr:hypothetical protein BYT27DRAFT_7095676 [Phlegmacium glaucopus]